MNDDACPALRTFEPATDLETLLSWFDSADDLLRWGGPGYQFPIEPPQFLGRLRLAEQPAYLLCGPDDAPLAFGQIYLRQRRLHFARLIVRKSFRGQRLGERLIAGLEAEGIRRWGRRPESLWVLTSNLRAIALYERIGFLRSATAQPFGPSLDVDLMVRPQPSAVS